MLQQFSQNWQAVLAADPGYAAWMLKDEEERMAAILAEEEARHHPYGPAENDTGYCWEATRQ
ncbi:MAG: hypothetical protein K1X53_12755 [Candidatus Sumerlaeaceae bacterium]|nr:hypothetical protein [Candidatus Sumerlaeaceae bacterium]